MKKEADRRGADVAPTSLTLGISSGRGVVSTRTCWLKLSQDCQLVSDKIGCASSWHLVLGMLWTPEHLEVDDEA